MPHRCEQETSRNCHAFNWIMGPILSQHNYSNDAPTRGSGTLSRTSSLLGLQLIAIELVKELSNFCRLRQSEREREENGKLGMESRHNRKTSLAALHSRPSSPSPSSSALPFPAGVRVAPAHGI